MKSHTLSRAALIAALYAVLCYLQNALLPGSGSFPIQFRAAEAMCILAFFTPAAIPGLTAGCLLFNLAMSPALPLDVLLGTAATALAAGAMYLTRNFTYRGLPLVGLLMPAICNGLIIGWELTVYIGGAFALNALYVAAGELAVLLTLGTGLYCILRNKRLWH